MIRESRREAVRAECCRRSKISHAGHNDSIGNLDEGWIRRDSTGVTKMLDGSFHGSDIASSVVHDSDHRSPFVLGNMRRKRRSCQQAARRARAKALNKDSILW
jgi:hypothetical protein